MFSLLKQMIEYLTKITTLWDEIQSKLEKSMATLKTFQDLLAAIDVETTRIAAKIDELVAKLAAGGMTEAEEAEVQASLTALSDRLKTIGTDPTDPVPPVV